MLRLRSVAALPVVAALVTVAILFAALAAPALAQPDVTESDPMPDAELAEPPEVISLCFTEPVRIDDPADSDFTVLTPGGAHLGLRIVFQRDGTCVDIFPGRAQGGVQGDWDFQWRVTSRADGEVGEGAFQFRVAPPTSPTPEASPEAPANGDEDGGPDILLMALVTTAVGIGAALVGLLLFLVRRRIGFWLHRPGPEESGAEERHPPAGE
jgi:methionine-rich copper-binding protein CopC